MLRGTHHTTRSPSPVVRGYLLATTLLLLAATATARHASDGSKARVIVIKTREAPFYNQAMPGLLKGLQSRGYRQGDRLELKTIALSGKDEADATLVKEQIDKHPQLIVTLGTDATRLVAAAKPEIPVVFAMILDPVNLGIVKSLQEPGGKFTGSTLLISPGKQFEALLQVCPKVHRIGVLYTDKYPTSLALLEEAKHDAQHLSLEITALAVQPNQKSKEALAQLKGQVDALWLIPDPVSTGAQELQAALDFGKANRLPVLGASSATVQAGALMALSAKIEDLGDITAEMAVNILDGTDTPVKMRIRGPRRTLLSVNLDSARELGISFPGTMLSLAEEVIDAKKESSDQ